MKRLLGFLLIPVVLAGMVSCEKDDDPPPPDPNVIFKATTITGAQEAPTPNASAATGTATLTFNTTTKIFTLNITHTIATPTNGHVHKGAMGVSGGVIFPFVAPFTSPINYTSPALDATQEADLFANLYYVNIHTAAFPAGEIRGQLIKQ